ncbi:Acyl-CoA dehydrogenase [compost metagenome]
MNLSFTPDEIAFRDEVRAFLRAELPERISSRVLQGKYPSQKDAVEWMRTLSKRGWLAPGWPVEHGGTDWSVVQKHIFAEECYVAGAPRPVPFGLNMVAPVIMKFGSEEQKQRHLPGILDCSVYWCQGYSEPGAGSDLAALKTRAVRDGDHYVVNGQKTWTSYAHYADWIFCLVRTDPEVQPQRGISFLLIDMKTPGITVRPIITLDGEHSVNEVFFDNVRVPVENRIGEENKGWTYAKYLLTHERTTLAATGHTKAMLARLKQVAASEIRDGKPLIDDPLFAAQIADVEMQMMATEISNLRALDAAREGGVPGAESSILKIKGTELRQQIAYLIDKAVGSYALPYLTDELDGGFDGELLHSEFSNAATGQYLDTRKASVFGGSNEIQKNIIAKMILEL